MSIELPVLDRSFLRSSLGHDQKFVEDILELFTTIAPGIIESLTKAANEGDLETVKNKAHSFKGSTGNIGARAMLQSMKNIEAACADEDLEAVREKVSEAISEYDRLISEIGKYRNQG